MRVKRSWVSLLVIAMAAPVVGDYVRADIEDLQRRKVNEVQVRINLQKGSIAGLKQQLESEHAKAADLEQAGQPVGDICVDHHLAGVDEHIGVGVAAGRVDHPLDEHLEAVTARTIG